MVVDRKKKFCNDCNSYRAYNAFDGSSTTCRSCETKKVMYLWFNDGIETLKKCVSCPKVLNACTGFYMQDSGNYTGRCKSCINEQNKARYRKDKNVMRCNRGFEFDGKRICRTCDKIATVDHFRDTRIDCRECLGLSVVPVRSMPKADTESNIEKHNRYRLKRVAAKKRKQDDFKKRWEIQ